MTTRFALQLGPFAVRYGGVIAMGALLIGCATLPEPIRPVAPMPQASENYVVSGKARIKAPDLTQSLRFRWQQQNGQYDIWLWGALGMSRTHLKGSEETFIISDGSQQISGSPGDLMRAHFGWSVPVGALGAWLRGAAASTMPVNLQQSDDRDRLIALQQGAWRVTFANYKVINNGWLPGRVSVVGKQLDLEIVLTWPQAVMTSNIAQPLTEAKLFDTSTRELDNSALENCGSKAISDC